MSRVDLHNHLLFGIDDGATDAAETLALARALVKHGYGDVAVTPHSKPDLDPAKDRVETRRSEVQQLLEREGVPLRLHPGCENHLTPSLLNRVQAGDPRPLGPGPYLLIELPFATPVVGLRDLLFKIQLKGLRPIIAHPERCAHFAGRMDAAREVFDAGVGFQIEVGSLANIYGPQARKCAQALLDEGMVAVAATDAHHLRSAEEILERGLKTLNKELGPSKLALLTEENPARVLRGAPLSYI